MNGSLIANGSDFMMKDWAVLINMQCVLKWKSHLLFQTICNEKYFARIKQLYLALNANWLRILSTVRIELVRVRVQSFHLVIVNNGYIIVNGMGLAAVKYKLVLVQIVFLNNLA